MMLPTALVAGMTVVLTLLGGWELGLLGALVAAFWAERSGRIAALGVCLAWLLMVMYSYVTSTVATQAMAASVGSILGGVPAALMPLLSIALGALLGGLIGLIAGQVRQAMAR